MPGPLGSLLTVVPPEDRLDRTVPSTEPMTVFSAGVRTQNLWPVVWDPRAMSPQLSGACYSLSVSLLGIPVLP